MFSSIYIKTIISAVILFQLMTITGYSKPQQSVETTLSNAMTAPANDDFANAEFLFGTQVHIVRSNVGASSEYHEWSHAGNPGGSSVWFTWTAPRSGTYSVSTNRTSSDLDTLLEVCVGNSADETTVIAESNNINAPADHRSFVSFEAIQGGKYYIVVDGASYFPPYPAEGTFQLDIQPRFTYQGADYDSDGMTDLSVFRPSTGTFYVFDSSSQQAIARQWGTNGDIPIVSSSNYQFKNDYAVFRPSTGVFYALSDIPSTYILNWGVNGDIPVPAQYSGDSYTNSAVFRPSNGTWYFYYSSINFFAYQFGAQGDIPVPGQYTPDKYADVAVFRPSTGVWYFRKRTTITPNNDTYNAIAFGQAGDRPVPADYDGDGLLDIAIYRPSTGTWWVLQSSNNQAIAFAWGIAEDIPTTGDFDGDGKFDYAVFRPSTGYWYIHRSSDGAVKVMQFGQSGDIPVTANRTF